MACAACAAHVEECLRNVGGVTDVSVSLLLRSASVDYDPSVVSLEAMKSAVNGIGYDLIIDDETSVREVEQRASSVLKRRVLLAWLFAAVTMAMGMHWIDIGSRDMNNQAMLLLALASIIVCGRGFYVNCFRSALHLQATMDTLVTLSTGITFLFSSYNTFFGDATWGSIGVAWHTYFDTPTMIIAFVLTGRLLEERAKDSTSSSIRELMGIAPKTARLVEGDVDGEHTLHEIPIATIKKGDLLEVRAGDRMPVDGKVVRGESFMDTQKVYVDESMLTGEPTPVGKGQGDEVLNGTIVSQGRCVVEARLTGGDTALERIICVVREALESKSAVQRMVDKASAIFVPVVLAAAVVTFVCWMIFGGRASTAQAIMHAVAVIVIACPCAMGLAAPTALMVGIGKAAKKHILIKDVGALETLKKVDAMVIDKTGTLTIPNPNIDFTKASDLPYEERERLKDDAHEVMEELESSGVEVHLMSGDTPGAVEYWAAKAGISRFESKVLPGDKEALVRRLQGEGKTVAMVGDGINDTQALAVADISIAMGTGTDIAMDISKVTLMGDKLHALIDAIDISRRTVGMIWQNLFWAFIYNIIFIPLAAGVTMIFGVHLTISPMMASGLMALSSISVVLNSLRLNGK